MFKSGDVLLKKGDLGLPGVTLREYVLVREPYRKYGQLMGDLMDGGQYSRMYPLDQFELKTQDRIAELTALHAKWRASHQTRNVESR